MIDNLVLESIEAFCKERIAPRFKFQVPKDDNIMDYQLQHPNVFIGWLPPPGQLTDVEQILPNGMKSALPAMVIGMDDGDDDGTDAGIGIRITFIIYRPGFFEVGAFTPDFKGYRDLLNLTYHCRMEFSKQCIMPDGRTAAQKPFRWGMYQEQPSGYYLGYFSFRASAISTPNHLLD